MTNTKIKDDNYYQISGWMINRLNLKGVALSAYAIIYGFTQDGENEFTGSVQYLCDFVGGVSKPTIIKALKELVEKGYIFKREEFINGVQFNRYKVNLQAVNNLNGGSKETLLGVVNNFNEGSKETLLNNNINNNSLNNNSNNKASKAKSFDAIIADFTTDPVTVDLLQEWLKVRKAKRAAMTDRAIKINIGKLEKLAKASNMTVNDYLTEVIARGWAAFYEIKQWNNNGKTYGKTGVEIKTPAEDDLAGIF